MSTVTVHALSTGTLTLPESAIITPADSEARRTVPSLSFLIQHHGTDKTTRLLFDLGLRHDVNLYPPVLQKHCLSRLPMTTTPDAVASLARGGLSIHDIDYIIFSHVHYDHVGLPKDFSDPSTKFIVGPGALDLLSGVTSLNIGSHSYFESDLLPADRTIELPSTTNKSVISELHSLTQKVSQRWSALPPFPHAVDLFSDGTVFIVSAPGHLPGHINLLCRISTDKCVLLAGDACHDMRLFTGERDIATWTDDEGRYCCVHADIPAAKETIKRLAQVQKEGVVVNGVKADVEVVFAHNWEWAEDASQRNRFWPGKI